MKKYISHLVFALLGCAALSACVDDDSWNWIKDRMNLY